MYYYYYYYSGDKVHIFEININIILLYYTMFLSLLFVFTHGTCHVYLPSCFTDIIAPFYWRWNINFFYETVYLPSLLLLTRLLLVVMITHILSLYSKLLWLVKSMVLLVPMLQLLFYLLSAIPRENLPASLCCETSYRGYLESAWLNALTFFIFILTS